MLPNPYEASHGQAAEIETPQRVGSAVDVQRARSWAVASGHVFLTRYLLRTTFRRHRWRPRFSLRTLFVVVTVLSLCMGWLMWQVQIVQERKAMLTRIKDARGHFVLQREWVLQRKPIPAMKSLSWTRRILGDQAIALIWLQQDSPTKGDSEFYDALRAVFSEADVSMVLVDGPDELEAHANILLNELKSLRAEITSTEAQVSNYKREPKSKHKHEVLETLIQDRVDLNERYEQIQSLGQTLGARSVQLQQSESP